MLVRFPAPPGGLARRLSVSQSAQDGEVVIAPQPSTPPEQQTSAAAATAAVDATPSLLKLTSLSALLTKP